jgi:hypothetical protein
MSELHGPSEPRPQLIRANTNSTKSLPPRRSGVFACICEILCLLLFAAGAAHSARGQTEVEEYQVKAAFLFHFAQLVDWPDGALDPQDHSLILCTFDGQPQLHELQSTLEGKLIGERVLHIRLLSDPQAIPGCNILFLSRDEGPRQSAILRDLRDRPILTVGETESFLSDGGMIRFHLEADRIRFDINLAAADSAHLKISSRLLLLATSVTGRPPTNWSR